MRTARFERHPGLLAVFTSKADGDQSSTTDAAAAALARAAVLRRVGADPAVARLMRQVHSATVAPVAGAGEPAPTADALLDVTGTTAPVVLTADCVPVLLAGRRDGGPVLAAAHAGRRGLLDGVLPATVAALRAAGAEELEAWIGPSICGACYEVPAALRDEAEALLPGVGTLTRQGTPALDLPGAAAAQLRGLGVLTHASGCCTLEDPASFSYRGGDTTARLASLVVAVPAA